MVRAFKSTLEELDADRRSMASLSSHSLRSASRSNLAGGGPAGRPVSGELAHFVAAAVDAADHEPHRAWLRHDGVGASATAANHHNNNPTENSTDRSAYWSAKGLPAVPENLETVPLLDKGAPRAPVHPPENHRHHVVSFASGKLGKSLTVDDPTALAGV